MAISHDRVGELLSGIRHKTVTIMSPEGVSLPVALASKTERCAALAIDLAVIFGSVTVLYVTAIMLFFSNTNISVGMTLILFLTFLVRNLYFIHFELAWRGRTPGKKACHLRVINRYGGELTPASIVARNLIREVELFLPISLLFSLGMTSGTWQELTLLGWVAAMAFLPFFNREQLRAGDIIGGTMVVSLPKHMLMPDLTSGATVTTEPQAHFLFKPDQLGIYGRFELQVLEEFLRRPSTPETLLLLTTVCEKIRYKIQWPEPVQPHMVRRFLQDFYAAERAALERGQLFGKVKEDKFSH